MRVLDAAVATLVISGCGGTDVDVGVHRAALAQRAVELGVLAESGAPVAYEVADGYALADDIVLGPIDEVRAAGVRRIVVGAPLAPGVASDARVGVMATTRWPLGVLPVQFAASVSAEQRALVTFSLRALERRTALRFPVRTSEPDAIEVMSGNGCWSTIGHAGGVQQLSLGSGCQRVGVVVHEFMHAAGWAHEQCRADRDTYVVFHPENVRPNFGFNFDVLAVDDDDHVGPYDFDSVMHYGAYDFSDAGGVVLEPRDASVPLERLGQRCGPSALDLASIRATYPGAPVVGPEVGLSATELRQAPHEVGRTVVVDVGSPAEPWTLSVSSSDRSIVETEGPAAAISLVERCEGLFTVRITGQPKSGSAIVRFRLTEAGGAVVERAVTYVVEGTAANAPTAFSSQSFYFYGDRVLDRGRVYMNVTLRDLGRGYEVWGNQRTGGFTCGPATCSQGTPASYASIRLFWVEAPVGPAMPFVLASAGSIDAGTPRLDAGVVDAGVRFDAGGAFDAGAPLDAGPPGRDAGSPLDAGPPLDAGAPSRDAGAPFDAGAPSPADDAGTPFDAGAPSDDAGAVSDAGEPSSDAGAAADAGPVVSDAGAETGFDAAVPNRPDAGWTDGGAAHSTAGVEGVEGLACTSAPGASWLVLMLLVGRRLAHRGSRT